MTSPHLWLAITVCTTLAVPSAYAKLAGNGLAPLRPVIYHVLNHLNLFGGSYLVQAQAAIDGLLGEIRA